MTEALRRFGIGGVVLVTGSVVAWALILILIPHLMLLDYALHASDSAIARGAPAGWTFHSFLPLFDPNDTLLRSTLARTLVTSGVITVLALIVCYPVAYYLAKVATRGWLSLLMLALLVPFWVNEVLRAYAWRTLLSRNGLINQVGAEFGLAPIEFFNYQLPVMDANIALFIGLVYSYVLFMVFP
ncbi:MAG: ABC transporter permease, partial [Gemmobacter sp.]